jgi:uncharacterized protein (DUF952 family)
LSRQLTKDLSFLAANLFVVNMPVPQFVFKIVTWIPDLDSPKVRLPELDSQSGFIHLSTAQQVPRVADIFFLSEDKLRIIKIPYDKIKDNVKWEGPPDSFEQFPHLYGDLLSTDVDSVRTFDKGQGSWKGAFGAETWLFGQDGEDAQ